MACLKVIKERGAFENLKYYSSKTNSRQPQFFAAQQAAYPKLFQ